MNSPKPPRRPRPGSSRRPASPLCILAGAAVAILGSAESALAASPSLQGFRPPGARRGADTEVEIRGERLSDMVDLLFDRPGISLGKVQVTDDQHVKAVLQVAPACALGPFIVRVRTKSGISDARLFSVSAFPEVAEVEPNGEFGKPQKVGLDVTITGVVESEDVDFFSFEARKGQRVSAEVEGMRLGGEWFDPHLTILNSARFEVAASDDSPLGRQDPIASLVIPEDGVYVVEVRESSYRGNGNSRYRLHLGGFPRPQAVFPAGGKAGEEVEVTYIGDPAGPIKEKLRLPSEPDGEFALWPKDAGGAAPSPIPFRVSAFGGMAETEPNETPAAATKATAPPIALDGVIGQPGDVDHFRFPAKKGQPLDVHVYARRLRSPLDPVLTVLKEDGKAVGSNDDAIGPDSYLRFTPDADADYLVAVTDHLSRGGPGFVYRIEVTPVEPRLVLTVPKVQQNSQDRQAIAVPRGNRLATMLQVSRQDVGGDITISMDGLPAGVTVDVDGIINGLDAMPALLEAAPDAPLASSLASVVPRLRDPDAKAAGAFREEIDLAVGPNNNPYVKSVQDRLPVAVVEEAPFHIDVVEPKVPLPRSGSLGLVVKAKRAEGFTAPISLELVFNPPGVSSSGGVSIPEGKDEASIPVTANGGATIREWKISVAGTAPTKGGPVRVSSGFALLRIVPPFLTVKMGRAAAEQGKEAEIACSVEGVEPFDGQAKLSLVGLPPRVTADDVQVTKDTKEFTFKLKVDQQSPAGHHKNIFCQVELKKDGEPIVHGAGSAEIDIQTPLPPKKDASPAPKAEEKKPEGPKDAPKKPLSRLEKLRLESGDGGGASGKETKK